MNKPKALQKGDTVGLIAPSSPVASAEKIEMAIQSLRRLGFNVAVGDSVGQKYGYLSGSDYIRAQDINKMFSDKSIAGIICIRGGYGSMRILDMLDYDMIRDNPKVFVGYSDITALHIAFNKFCDFVTFHGPMAESDMINDFDDFTKSGFLKAVTSGHFPIELKNPPGHDIKSLSGGTARGMLIGGNLSLIASTLGTKYEINTVGRLLLLEDIGEEPYRVDRMLTQLKLAGKFDDLNGIILGNFKNCEAENPEKSLSLMQIFEDILVPYGKPIIYNFMTGHCKPKITVPFGEYALLDADKCSLTLTDDFHCA